MILREFPDLGWLKQQIDQRFQQRRSYHNAPLDTAGFPSVVINTFATHSYRPDVVGPISLFLNRKGLSHCSTDGRTVQIPEDHFFITNRFQPYTLTIDSAAPVETFNIHIGEYFSEGVLGALLTPADTILNDGLQQRVHTVAFYNQLYRRDERFNRLADALLQSPSTTFDRLLFEEKLSELLIYLLQQHRSIIDAVHKLPPIKQSTRVELYKRLSYAADYLHSFSERPVNLDELAGTACLSKYHFLRLFKLAYGITPYQYVQQLRLDKARMLLKHSSLAVQDIALALGFENSQSFSRLFHQRTGLYPTQYARN
jgi:AraC family transcriptional regulator